MSKNENLNPLKLEEERNDNILRPSFLHDFLGQEKLKENLKVFIDAAKGRGDVLDHALFYGPPGLGKTTLAQIISHEMGVGFKGTAGPVISKSGDLAAILTNLQQGDVLFIDEIHRLNKNVEEVLYSAMEDFKLDIIIGEGPAARAIKIDLPKFTLVGATTRAGLLPPPLRDRFGFTAHMEFYENEDLAKIIERSAKLLRIDIDGKSVAEIAGRSRGTPRIANRLLRRVRDFALVKNVSKIDLSTTQSALEMYEVDLIGLDRLDRAVLQALVERFNGGPVGLSTLAIAVGEETETVESVAEPFLVRQGLMARTARGRVATPAGFSHLGHKSPQGWSLFDSSEG